jgi:hypothetical protein
MKTMRPDETKTNWLAISVVALLVVAICLGVFGYASISKRLGSNERIVLDGLRNDLVVGEEDPAHIPCKACRTSLNAGLSRAAFRERGEIIFLLTTAKTGHVAHDSGLDHAIGIVRARND